MDFNFFKIHTLFCIGKVVRVGLPRRLCKQKLCELNRLRRFAGAMRSSLNRTNEGKGKAQSRDRSKK